jgi:hypothetical protein
MRQLWQNGEATGRRSAGRDSFRSECHDADFPGSDAATATTVSHGTGSGYACRSAFNIAIDIAFDGDRGAFRLARRGDGHCASDITILSGDRE